MNLKISSIEFSSELLFTTVSTLPRIIKPGMDATFEIRFVPHILGTIRVLCTITTNMGDIEYQVGLPV